MPRCLPSAAASVDLPAPIIPAMPMKMLPNASPWPCVRGTGPEPEARDAAGGDDAGGSISVNTEGACQPPLTSRPAGEPVEAALPAALVIVAMRTRSDPVVRDDDLGLGAARAKLDGDERDRFVRDLPRVHQQARTLD